MNLFLFTTQDIDGKECRFYWRTKLTYEESVTAELEGYGFQVLYVERIK